MEDFYPVVKVAAVQAAPEYLDRDATVEKACSLIDKAGSEGAKLVAFPEAFIPGYPWWIWFDEPAAGIPFFIKLYKNAVTVPGPAVQSLSEAAKRNGVYVCISVTEKDGASLYLTQLWFNPNGDLIGKHRKLKPSGAERYIWGEGDASMMPVFDPDLHGTDAGYAVHYGKTAGDHASGIWDDYDRRSGRPCDVLRPQG